MWLAPASHVDGDPFWGLVRSRGRGPLANRAGTERLTELAGLVENGRLRIPKLTVYPLDRAGEALAEQAERHVQGKMVIAMA